MSVEFRCVSANGRRYRRGLSRDAAALLRAAGVAACELSLTVVTDSAMRKLNCEFRKVDRPTDVLSFSQLEERGGAPVDPALVVDAPGTPLGDVVISIDTALAQAREFGVTPQSRLRTLLIHGFLHLLGYDHERSPAAARAMFARERELAAALDGVAVSAAAAKFAPRRKGPAR